MASQRSRTWWFVQLLENLPDSWEDDLKELMMPLCYIVHDKDDAAPHIHCIIQFGNAVQAKTVLEVLPESFGVGFVKPVASKVGAYRYLLHIDEPEKHQYIQEQITHLAGFNVNLSEVCGVSFIDVYDLVDELDIRNFSTLLSVVCELAPHMLEYVQSHVLLCRSYIQDRAYRLSQKK